ncbi:MAG: PqqD family protein [Candidatus Latescibacteria bacterium]|nr:PqqD family protein [Candidatus Latescibacterota bacterium]
MLRSQPRRNPLLTWDVNADGEVTITIPRRTGWKIALLTKLFYIPKQRVITLDEVGSRVWFMCDGKHTVAQMMDHMSQVYKLNQKEVEISLLNYLRTLGKKRIIGFLVKKESLRKRPGSGKRWIKKQ